MDRQIVIDLETTGLDPSKGHRVVELAAIELLSGRLTGKSFHCYLNPQRHIDEEAMMIHGLTSEFLQDKPSFSTVSKEFIDFVSGAELVTHNAPFDVAFLNSELEIAGLPPLTEFCPGIIDTLTLAKEMYPGGKYSLAALCKRYKIGDDSGTLHGALLDAQLLAEIYLAQLAELYVQRAKPEPYVVETIDTVHTEMVRYFTRNPHALYQMSPRNFEELVAGIFRNHGYQVHLTPRSRDGGVDIIAVEHSSLSGKSVHLIECKRYAATRRVGIGVVQRLLGAVTEKRATKGIVVTTSFFSRDAIRVAEEVNHIITLNDYYSLVAWLKAYGLHTTH